MNMRTPQYNACQSELETPSQPNNRSPKKHVCASRDTTNPTLSNKIQRECQKKLPESSSTKRLAPPRLSQQKAQRHLSLSSQPTPKPQHTSNRSLLRAQASQSFNPIPKDHHARPPMEVVDGSRRRVNGEEVESSSQEAVERGGRRERRPSREEAVEKRSRPEKKPSGKEAIQKGSQPERKPAREKSSKGKSVSRVIVVVKVVCHEGKLSWMEAAMVKSRRRMKVVVCESRRV
jgi:hypothetical protein